jgi:hypothetical protein
MAITDPNLLDHERRRRVRRTTLWLSLVALAFYIGFIAMSVRMAHG